METVLEVIKEQRARHLSRHQEFDVNAIFTEDDMREIYNTWLNDHTSWMNGEKLREYILLLASTDRIGPRGPASSGASRGARCRKRDYRRAPPGRD